MTRDKTSDLENESRTFTSFAERFLFVIGNIPFTRWAKIHGISPSTVSEWVNHGRLPRESAFQKLIEVTGIPEEWWLHGDKPLSKHQAASEAANVQKQHPDNQAAIHIEHYLDVRVAAGAGQVTPTDQVIINVSVNASEWRNYVGLNPKHIKVISVYGDSMRPTLQHGDQVLVDTACNRFIDNAIYVIQQGDLLRIKRIKLRLDGSIEVKSDNNHGFRTESYSKEEAAAFKVVGRVLPFKFGKYDL